MINSEGFGGRVPAVIKSKLLSELVLIQSSILLFLERISLIPLLFLLPKAK